MRVAKLRVVVVKNATKKLAIIAVSAIIMAISWSFQDSREEELKKSEAGLRGDNSKIQELQSYIDSAKKAMGDSTLVSKLANGNKGIDRNLLTDSIESTKDKYMLSDISMRMSAVSKLQDKDLQKDNMDIEHSLVTLNFSGLSDEILLSFIDQIIGMLPGYVSVDSLQLERRHGVDKNAIDEILHQKYLPLVGGSVSFHWMVPKAKEAAVVQKPAS